MVSVDKLFSKQAGSGADTLVLLHGFGSNHRVWDDIAKAFASTHRTVSYDLPGHGASLDFAVGLSAKSAARAILADLEARSVDRVHVVGHSLGGAVATLMAAMAPQIVCAMTLLAPGGYGQKINGGLLLRFARARTAEELHASLMAMSGPDAVFPIASMDARVEMRSVDGQVPKLVEIAAAISANNRQGTFPPEMLEKLNTPTSVLWGFVDPVLPFSQTEALPATFTLVPVAGAGHMLTEECARLVVETIGATVSRA